MILKCLRRRRVHCMHVSVEETPMPPVELLEPPAVRESKERITTAPRARLRAPAEPGAARPRKLVGAESKTLAPPIIVIVTETIIAATAIWAVTRYRIFPENFATPMVLLLVGAVVCGTAAWCLRQKLSQSFKPRSRRGLPICRRCGFLLRGEPSTNRSCRECGQPISEAVRRAVRRARGEWSGPRAPAHRRSPSTTTA